MWSGLRTNLLTISAKGVVYFLWVSCLGIFLHSYKALGLFINERRLCLNVSSLVSSHVSLLSYLCKNGRLTILFSCSPLCSLCHAIYTGVLLFSCPGLIWYDQWATLDTEANSVFLWKYPSFQAAGGKESRKPGTDDLDQLCPRNWDKLSYSLVLTPNTHFLLAYFLWWLIELYLSVAIRPLSCRLRVQGAKRAPQTYLIQGPTPSVNLATKKSPGRLSLFLFLKCFGVTMPHGNRRFISLGDPARTQRFRMFQSPIKYHFILIPLRSVEWVKKVLKWVN